MTDKSYSDGEEEYSYISENIRAVRERIERAARRAGRDPGEITLMAVSKTKPVEAIRAAFACGVTLIGENRVQELAEKLPLLDMNGRSAHLIGHLQTNKVKYIADKVDMIQSLDSLRLAQEIERQAQRAGRRLPVLVEVNIGREDAKSGVAPEDAESFAEAAAAFPHLEIQGLMAVPPVPEGGDVEKTRPYFTQMRKLFIDIARKKRDNINMHILSLGMSADFEVAIEEGSTLVRVGTSIFGKRRYA